MSNEQNELESKLIETQKQLDKWRAEGFTRRPIPDHFWAKAASFVGEYNISFVAKTLRINAGRLKRFIYNQNNNIKNSSIKNQFVEIMNVPNDSFNKTCQFELDCTTKSGQKLLVKTDKDIDINQLLSTFFKE